jgi:streptomycin 6-kinase
VFTVPEGFTAQFDPRSRAEWLAELPALAQRYATRWSLTPDGDALFGYVGVVWPVRRADGTPAMLKLSWPDDESRDEGLALATWAGDGAVQLLEHDDYALLMERLDPHCLDDEPVDTAVRVAGGLLRRLAVPAPELHRTVRAEARRWAAELPERSLRLGSPVPDRIMSAAVEHCEVLGPRAGSLLVNEDLHYFNVLRGVREPWLVIDPKPITGDPEFGVIPLLWNRYAETGGAQGIAARFAAIVAAADLDADLARAWTLVRAVTNWLWTLEDGGFPSWDVLAEIAHAMAD